jgi:hypothetical protein
MSKALLIAAAALMTLAVGYEVKKSVSARLAKVLTVTDSTASAKWIDAAQSKGK